MKLICAVLDSKKPVEDGERSISLVEATQRALQLQDSNPHYIVKGTARSGAELGGRTKSRSLPLPRFLFRRCLPPPRFLPLASSSGVALRWSPGRGGLQVASETKKKSKIGMVRRWSPGRERDEEEEQKREGSVSRLVVCDLVNVRGKVVISSFTYNGLTNRTKNGGIV
ncbi:hypothetical protein Syun_010097 [Stephania yunnanensis]|uniref:Uncharacterized protein n=1 Tax=Stephania yunnanensis TaxID=152371 RepID=A0AAP0KHI0_9MAGN